MPSSISILHGDCLTVLPTLAPESVDLIVTSPPYAKARSHLYPSIDPDEYVEWFLPRAAEMKRVLKGSGSFILNIKECCIGGERHTYVMELILAMRDQGWLFTEEYVWHKKNCYPGKWPNRFRDAWERCIHFTKARTFWMDQDAVRVPVGDWAKVRLANLSETDKSRHVMRTHSKLDRKVSNWIGRDSVYPTNVLSLPTECANRGHSAVFPEALPSWFIKLLCPNTGTVLDPFAGSFTTLKAALKLGRTGIGIEIKEEYCELASKELGKLTCAA